MEARKSARKDTQRAGGIIQLPMLAGWLDQLIKNHFVHITFWVWKVHSVRSPLFQKREREEMEERFWRPCLISAVAARKPMRSRNSTPFALTILIHLSSHINRPEENPWNWPQNQPSRGRIKQLARFCPSVRDLCPCAVSHSLALISYPLFQTELKHESSFFPFPHLRN